MTEDEAKPYAKPIPFWVPDTRAVIVCWMMMSTFIIIMSLMVFGTPKGEGGQLLNTLLGMYVGTGMITSITWWMGSSKGSDANNKMQEKMSEAIRPALVPVVPVAPVPWWGKLKNGEAAAITSAAANDPKVMAFVTAANVGVATTDDLAYLVSKGLLTQDRAAAIQA